MLELQFIDFVNGDGNDDDSSDEQEEESDMRIFLKFLKMYY